MIPIVIAIIATLVIVAPITWLISSNAINKRNDATIGNANEKAREIIDEALKTAETKKKEALLEVKEESLKTKNELEKETKERRAEISKYEKRVLSKEETLDRKIEAVEKRDSNITRKEEELGKQKQKVEELELSESIFAAEISEYAVYEVIKNHLANRRQGTQSAKTRAEVRGGGRKPWRQKGTGRARQGSTRSPQWIGGGVVFAPKPRDYSYSVNKKVRRLALKSVLTTKVNEGNLIVLDALEMNAPKTKDFIAMLSAVNAGKKALVVTAENSPNVVKSGRNIPGVDITFVNTLNVYDIMRHDSLIITKEAVRKTEEVYA